MTDLSLSTFQWQRSRPLPVLEGHFHEYRHSSGATLLHVDAPDPSLTLSVSFRTPPWSNAGHPHVLEHMVLLGSARYPSGRAFSEVQRGALLDYLNASTTRDWTTFTASSVILDDALSALDFFLDAAFHPLLTEQTFRQEAWRVTPGGALSGVIYNEMRGALQHPARRMRAALGSALFPGTPYAFQAGGTPDDLPSLGLDELRRYHAQHYVPANAVFYVYGQAPLQPFAARIDRALAAQPPGQAAARPRPCGAGQELLSVSHPKSAQSLLAWAMPASLDPQHLPALNVLALALLGHSDAPLCRAMRALGAEIADGTGFHADTAQPVFAIGCRAAVSPDTLRRAVTACLERPLAQQDVRAALGRYTLGALDTQHHGFPYGVQLSFDVLGAQHHGHDAYPANLGGALTALEQHPDLPGFLRQLTKRHLLDNLHQAVILMRTANDPPGRRATQGPAPSTSVDPSQEACQTAPVPHIAPLPAPSLLAADARAQVRPPRTLRAADLAAACVHAPLHTLHVAGSAVQAATLPGALIQASVSRGLNGLSAAQVQALPAYLAALPRSELGRTLTLELRALGTQWSLEVDTTHDPFDPQRVRASLTLNLQGLRASFSRAMQVLARNWLTCPVLAGPVGSPDQAGWLLSRAAQLAANVPQGAAQYAMLRAAWQVNPGFVWRETFDGLSAHDLLRQAARLPDLGHRLTLLHGQLWGQGALQAVVVGDDTPESLSAQLAPFVRVCAGSEHTAADENALEPWPGSLQGPDGHPELAGTAVHAVATVAYVHPQAAALTVLGRVLHERLYAPIRAQGGAYGVTARSLPEAGVFMMVSARDPQPQRTRSILEQIHTSLHDLTAEDVDAARMVAVRLIHPLRSLAMQTRQAALDSHTGYSPALRQQFLESLLRTTAQDVQEAASLLNLPVDQTSPAPPQAAAGAAATRTLTLPGIPNSPGKLAQPIALAQAAAVAPARTTAQQGAPK